MLMRMLTIQTQSVIMSKRIGIIKLRMKILSMRSCVLSTGTLIMKSRAAIISFVSKECVQQLGIVIKGFTVPAKPFMKGCLAFVKLIKIQNPNQHLRVEYLNLCLQFV
jgi:hypothetical protein